MTWKFSQNNSIWSKFCDFKSASSLHNVALFWREAVFWLSRSIYSHSIRELCHDRFTGGGGGSLGNTGCRSNFSTIIGFTRKHGKRGNFGCSRLDLKTGISILPAQTRLLDRGRNAALDLRRNGFNPVPSRSNCMFNVFSMPRHCLLLERSQLLRNVYRECAKRRALRFQPRFLHCDRLTCCSASIFVYSVHSVCILRTYFKMRWDELTQNVNRRFVQVLATQWFVPVALNYLETRKVHWYVQNTSEKK
jgi:hypothetical protein